MKKKTLNHIFKPTFFLTSHLPYMAAGFHLFASIAWILKLKANANYKKWRNFDRGFCEINGLLWYILGQIAEPKAFSI